MWQLQYWNTLLRQQNLAHKSIDTLKTHSTSKICRFFMTYITYWTPFFCHSFRVFSRLGREFIFMCPVQCCPLIHYRHIFGWWSTFVIFRGSWKQSNHLAFPYQTSLEVESEPSPLQLWFWRGDEGTRRLSPVPQRNQRQPQVIQLRRRRLLQQRPHLRSWQFRELWIRSRFLSRTNKALSIGWLYRMSSVKL